MTHEIPETTPLCTDLANLHSAMHTLNSSTIEERVELVVWANAVHQLLGSLSDQVSSLTETLRHMQHQNDRDQTAPDST